MQESRTSTTFAARNKKQMKEIKYFLDAEDRYNQANLETVFLWINGTEGIERDHLSFLQKNRSINAIIVLLM